MKTITILENDANQRLDKFLKKAFPALPKPLLYKAIRKKDIKRNSRRTAIDERLCAGDVLTVYLPDETLTPMQVNRDFLQASKELSVAFEDMNLLVLEKPAGLLSHPDGKIFIDTLIARVLRYLYEKGEYTPEQEHSFTPALINRLDRNTGGLLIAAKTAQSLRILNRKMKDGEIQKKYLCAAVGKPPQQTFSLCDFLSKDSATNTVRIFECDGEKRKEIRTDVSVLAQKGGLSLLDIDLRTGRSHQIRAQLAHHGLPLLGDNKYGDQMQNKRYGQKTQCLYAYQIRFTFQNDDGELAYLNGRTFQAQSVWFRDLF